MSTELEMLRAVLVFAEAHEDDDSPLVTNRTRKAFQKMADDLDAGVWRKLSDRQLQWVRAIYELVSGTPTYANEWSAGKVPKGRDVPTPDVLRNLPKRPPQRRAGP